MYTFEYGWQLSIFYFLVTGGTTTESVLQKFRKTFSLRFQKKGSKDSCSSEAAEPFSEILGEPSEEDSPQRVPSLTSTNNIDAKEENSEQKYRYKQD